MPPIAFEAGTPASDWLQTLALDSLATGIVSQIFIQGKELIKFSVPTFNALCKALSDCVWHLFWTQFVFCGVRMLYELLNMNVADAEKNNKCKSGEENDENEVKNEHGLCSKCGLRMM